MGRRETYDERRERERRDPYAEPSAGHETYDEQLERWRRGWVQEYFGEDCDNG